MVQERIDTRGFTDQQWFSLIQECRTSGMSDKNWCEIHGIHKSSLYYHIKQLRKKSCEIPASTYQGKHPPQEIVEILPSEAHTVLQNTSLYKPKQEEHPSFSRSDQVSAPVVEIKFRGIHVSIKNDAASETIRNTIAALAALC